MKSSNKKLSADVSENNAVAAYLKKNGTSFFLDGKPCDIEAVSIRITREMSGIYTRDQEMDTDRRIDCYIVPPGVKIPSGANLELTAENEHGDIARLTLNGLTKICYGPIAECDIYKAESVHWWRWDDLDLTE